MPKTLPTTIDKNSICLVAIIKNEEKFLDEWLVYHHMLGIQHFFLYDDDPAFPMEHFLKPHAEYCTPIPWRKQYNNRIENQGNQVTAYQHALQNHIQPFEWVVFLDVDEFIVLRKHRTIHQFLVSIEGAVSVSLNWHLFGHNGFFDDPERLITTSLSRRMLPPSKEIKTITKTQYIAAIDHPHYCQLKEGKRVDANNEVFKSDFDPGRTRVAHINHYHCRSFNRWMQRPDRGDVNFDDKFSPPEHKWRLSKDLCLKTFVTTVAKTHNEHTDKFMFKHRFKIHERLLQLNRGGNNLSIPPLSADIATTTIKKQLNTIANIIVANYQSVENTSLFYGKTGLAIFLFNYADYANKPYLKKHAFKILDDIAEQIDINSIPDYANGLAGYGCAIEYAVERAFLKIDTNEVLESLDTALHYHLITHSFSGINLYTGVSGIGRYYISRLNNPFNEANHKHDKDNREIIEKIIDLYEAPFDTYEDCLSVIDFMSNVYGHCSQQYTKIKHYLHYAADKLETMFYEDMHFNVNSDDFNPLGAVDCLLRAYDLTGEEILLQKANFITRQQKAYYDNFIETMQQGGRLSPSKWILYLRLANAFQNNQLENNFNKWLQVIINQSKQLSDHSGSSLRAASSLDLFSGIAGTGMLLLAIMQADDRDILKLFPF